MFSGFAQVCSLHSVGFIRVYSLNPEWFLGMLRRVSNRFRTSLNGRIYAIRFNRINIEVLSVVAQQIHSILTALSLKQKRFVFQGKEIPLSPQVGIFITMNPGYAGRTELPDNLTSMFRPVSMVTPDSIYIAENFLFSEGFQNTRVGKTNGKKDNRICHLEFSS